MRRLVCALVAFAVMAAPEAAGAPEWNMAVQATLLPQPVAGHSAVITPEGTVYTFGGEDGGLTADIMSYETAGGQNGDVLLVGMPAPTSGTSAVWISGSAYIFGGSAGPRDIVAFDPSVPSVTLLDQQLPADSVWTSAVVWGLDESPAAYIFGAGPGSDLVIRFDPVSGLASPVAVLPQPMPASGAAIAQAPKLHPTFSCGPFRMYVAGGGTRDIIEFDPGVPVAEAFNVFRDILPEPWSHPAMVSFDSSFVALGGVVSGQVTDVVWNFGCGNLQMPAPGSPLPMALGRSAAVRGAAIGGGFCTWVVGGRTADGGVSDRVVRWGPLTCQGSPPDAATPPSFTATVQPGCGATHVTFEAQGGGSWEWQFGDGHTGAGSPAFHTYQASGEMQVTLEAMDGGEAATSVQVLQVVIAHCPPTLAQPHDAVLMTGESVERCAVAAAAEGGPLRLHHSGVPPGATWSNETGCMRWTAPSGMARHERLARVCFAVTEEPWSLTVERCFRIVVVDPTDPVADADNDGVADGADNCPGNANRDQVDADVDGRGDACDGSPAGSEALHDGDATSVRAGAHRHSVMDDRGACPDARGPRRAAQDDHDRDGLGDSCDVDSDGDGILDVGTEGLYLDNCPGVANADQSDVDGDGQGDACDAPASPARPGEAARGVVLDAVQSSAWTPYILVGVVLGGIVVGLLALALRRRSI